MLFRRMFLGLVIGLLLIQGAAWADLLAVSFGHTADALQAGFQRFDAYDAILGTGAVTNTYGSYSVTANAVTPSSGGASGAYEDGFLGSGSYFSCYPSAPNPVPLGDLYNSYLFTNNDGSGHIDVTIAGLQLNTAYKVTLYSYAAPNDTGNESDWYANGWYEKNTFTPTGGTTGVSNHNMGTRPKHYYGG